jgi:phosphohistidine swiveling domain-containing protein
MEVESNDMQDMEFTVQQGQLFILQTRTGKRSAKAAFRIAADFLAEGKITTNEALKRVTGKQFLALKRPTIAAGFKRAPTFTGLPAAGSIVTGKVVVTAEAAKSSKEPCILVTHETTPDDFGGMMASVGILTATGGATSHAAVVARGMDKTCVVGVSGLIPGKNVKTGDKVTIDGSTGKVWVNVDVPVVPGQLTDEAKYLLSLAKELNGSSASRIVLEPNEFLQQVPETGWVVLDVRQLAMHKRGKQKMRELMTLLTGRKQLSGILDFTENYKAMHEEDIEALKFLGVATEPQPDTIVPATVIERGLCLAKWTKSLVKRWVVNLKQTEGMEAVLERGFGTVKAVSDLRALLDCDGVVDVDQTLVARLTEDKVALADMLALLQAAGREITLLPKTADEDEVAFDVLGK